MGGPSLEHDVSLNSGRQILAALKDEDPVSVVIHRDGTWAIDEDVQPSVGRALDALAQRVEVVFIALHGPFGEDGTVQALFESFGLAYTGSSVGASSLAMDKARAKLVYRSLGLPTADFVVVSARPGPVFGGTPADIEAAAKQLGLPMVVKPLCNGSSFGISFPNSLEALGAAVADLHQDATDVLLEQMIQGTELTCGVLDLDGVPTAMPVTEIVPAAKYSFFDYEAKYTPGATDEITPARIDERLRDRIQGLALAAHQGLGCRDMSRTDVIVDASGTPFLLETNTVPGFTATSLLPQAAQVYGLDFPELVCRLVRAAAGRK